MPSSPPPRPSDPHWVQQRLPRGIQRRRRSDGTYRYLVRWYDAQGRRHGTTLPTLREAEIFRADRLRDVEAGTAGGSTTLEAWWARWSEGRDLRATTMAKREHLFRQHIAPDLGMLPLHAIDNARLGRYRAKLETKHSRLGKPLSDSSVAMVLELLKACLDAAVSEGAIRRNPAASLAVPRQRPSVPDREIITWPEAIAIEEAMDPWWSIIVPFGMESALRIGEMAALRVKDVDLVTGTVHVRRSMAEVPTKYGQGSIVEGKPKTRAGSRRVRTLTRETATRLGALIEDRSLVNDDFLFSGRDQGRMRPNTFRRRFWNPAVREAGIAQPFPTPHMMRHSAISYWLASGLVTLQDASKMAGHSSIRVTVDVYGHLIDSGGTELQEALARARSDARGSL